MTCDFLPPLARVCFPPFEQLIGKQPIQLQDSILERLHHHTLSNMLSDGISEAHHAQMLSCFGLGVDVWFIAWPIFVAFWLSSLVFSTTLHTRLRLPHLSTTGIPQCVCPHPIDFMGIHFLYCAHECIGAHDVIHDIFAAIVQDVNFHLGRE